MTAPTADDLQTQADGIIAKQQAAVQVWQTAGKLIDTYGQQLKEIADQIAALDTGAAIPTTADEVAQLESDLETLTGRKITDYVVTEPVQPLELVTP